LRLRGLVRGGGAPAYPHQLRARPVGPQPRSEAVENLEAQLESLAGGTLVLRLSVHRPEQQKRPGELERIRLLRRLGRLGRGFECGDRLLVIRAGSAKHAPAANRKRAKTR